MPTGACHRKTLRLDESRLWLERVLTLQPDNAKAHNNLANTCKRLGLLDQAEQHWTRALALHPNYPEPYSRC
jgi:Flp pilus assembly protein TadD